MSLQTVELRSFADAVSERDSLLAGLSAFIDYAQALFDQVDGAGYRDAHGHPLENNAAYLAIKAAVAGEA